MSKVQCVKCNVWLWVGWCLSIIYNGKQSGELGYVVGGGTLEYTIDLTTATVGTELGNPDTILSACLVPVTT